MASPGGFNLLFLMTNGIEHLVISVFCGEGTVQLFFAPFKFFSVKF